MFFLTIFPVGRWICEFCGDNKIIPGSYVMRLLMEVEARVNQADGLHKNEVSFLNFCFKYLLCMLAIHLSF